MMLWKCNGKLREYFISDHFTLDESAVVERVVFVVMKSNIYHAIASGLVDAM